MSVAEIGAVAVAARLGSRIRGFRLVASEHGLVLEGRSYTYFAKQLAQHAVMEMTGLPVVANRIAVVPLRLREEGWDDVSSI